MSDNSSTNKWAVIELGGKHHLVSAGTKIKVNRLAEPTGETLQRPSMLDQSTVGLKILGHFRGEKVNGLKFKNKVRYIRRYGHRQELTEVEVVSIGSPAAKKPPLAKAAPKKSTKAVSKKTTPKG